MKSKVKIFFLGVACLALITCATVSKRTHGLQGGVKEPVYPPDSIINCWVQPPGDDLWYPCQQDRGIH